MNHQVQILAIPFNEDIPAAKESLFCAGKIKENSLDGLIIGASQLNREEFTLLQKHSFPFILVATSLHSTNFNWVCPDYYQAAFLLFEHLLSSGHQQIGFVGGLHHTNIVDQDRFRAYQDVMKAHSLYSSEEFWQDWDYRERDKFPQIAREFIAEHRNLTAICSPDDLMALQIITEAEKSGLSVPKDLAVAGFGNFSEGRDFRIPLTTIRLRRKETGRIAFKSLYKMVKGQINKPVQLFLEPELIVRESTSRVS